MPPIILKDNSGGKFSPEFVVVGPVLLPKEMGFYGENKTATYEPNATTNDYRCMSDCCRTGIGEF